MHKAIQTAVPFTVEATVVGTFDVAGRKHTYNATVKTVSAGDGRFWHEMVGYGLIVSDGKTLTFYDPNRNSFAKNEAAVKIASNADLPKPLRDILIDENPLLLLSLSTDPNDVLTGGSDSVKVIDTKIGTEELLIQSETKDVRIATDARTHQMRRVAIDFAKAFDSRGIPDAKATIVINYQNVRSLDSVDVEWFNFVPPPTATEFKLPLKQPTGDELITPGPVSATQSASE